MNDEKKFGNISATIGDVSGGAKVAVGNEIKQQDINYAPPVFTEADMNNLRQMFEELRVHVAKTAPPDQKDKALERIDELKEAVTAEKPNLTTMEHVKNWFCNHIPTIAGSVTGLIVHPLVGKLVEVGGDALASSFRSRFGIEKK